MHTTYYFINQQQKSQTLFVRFRPQCQTSILPSYRVLKYLNHLYHVPVQKCKVCSVVSSNVHQYIPPLPVQKDSHTYCLSLTTSALECHPPCTLGVIHHCISYSISSCHGTLKYNISSPNNHHIDINKIWLSLYAGFCLQHESSRYCKL